MIDLADIAEDPDLGQAVLITRSYGQFGPGGWQSTASHVTAYGVVTPARDRDVQMIPEGDRVGGALLFITSTPIFPTRAAHEIGEQSAVSDQITWREQRFRVASVGQWEDAGFYAAVLVRMAGD